MAMGSLWFNNFSEFFFTVVLETSGIPRNMRIPGIRGRQQRFGTGWGGCSEDTKGIPRMSARTVNRRCRFVSLSWWRRRRGNWPSASFFFYHFVFFFLPRLAKHRRPFWPLIVSLRRVFIFFTEVGFNLEILTRASRGLAHLKLSILTI